MSKIKEPKEWILEHKYAPQRGLELEKLAWTAKAYSDYRMKAELNDDKLFELAELLAEEVFGEKGLILYSERQELTVKLFEIIKSKI